MSSRPWLVVTDEEAFARALREQCQIEGVTFLRVRPAAEFRRISPGEYEVAIDNPHQLEILFSTLKQNEQFADGVEIVHQVKAAVHALDGEGSVEQSLEDLARGVLALGKMVASRRPGRLWLLTRNALRIAPNDGPNTGVLESTIWGFGRILGHEHPEVWGGLVDIDHPDREDSNASLLLAHVRSNDGESDVAFRNRNRYVARLRGLPNEDVLDQSWSWRSDRAYVISGGTGDLGLALAEHAFLQGARHFVLLSRTNSQRGNDPNGRQTDGCSRGPPRNVAANV